MPSRLARSIVCLFVLLLGLSAGPVLAEGPCDPILQACTKLGYAPGAASKNKGLVADCLQPILKGDGGTGDLPVIDPGTIVQCKASREAESDAKSAQIADGTKAPGPLPVKALPAPKGQPAAPNIVFVLVDDFSLDLMTSDQDILNKSMPNVAQMMKDGATFTNHFVTDSLCCPSRTSILTGLLPHNSKVFTNNPPYGGFSVFMSSGDDGKTFALPLHDRFYATGFMGKYLNGYLPERDGVPQGWSEWAVAGDGYANFNYLLNDDGTLTRSPLHLTDKLSELGQAFIRASAGGPFILEVATFSPHGPYVPPTRYKDLWPELEYPKTPAYGARPDDTAPPWLQEIPKLSPGGEKKMAEGYRNRVRSDKGIDDMVGALRKTLDELGLTDSTYVIFTSDNGYHMGEYSLRAGKMTPFDTDIHVPLVVVGPGIAAGRTIDDVTMNIDFNPTFTDWAGSPANPEVDGKSLAGLLRGEDAGPWRRIAVVEHRHDDGKAGSDNPDDPPLLSGNPPDYTALRLADAMYVEYTDGSGLIGYYDLKTDPYQLHNIAPTLTEDRKKALHDALEANATCKGLEACWAAQSLTP